MDMSQRVALVDDDRNILTSVAMALEAEGFAVDSYTDGEAALRGIGQTPVDLAVLEPDIAALLKSDKVAHDINARNATLMYACGD